MHHIVDDLYIINTYIISHSHVRSCKHTIHAFLINIANKNVNKIVPDFFCVRKKYF
jgi:hypothetical protein